MNIIQKVATWMDLMNLTKKHSLRIDLIKTVKVKRIAHSISKTLNYPKAVSCHKYLSIIGNMSWLHIVVQRLLN